MYFKLHAKLVDKEIKKLSKYFIMIKIFTSSEFIMFH